MSGPLDVIGGGASGVITGSVPPVAPSNGTMWYDSVAAQLKLWDAVTGAWLNIGSAAGAGGGGAVVSTTPPVTPTNGTLWYDPGSGSLKVSFGGLWFAAAGSSGGGGATSGTTAPATPIPGTLWYDTAAAALKVFDGANWVITSGVPPAGAGVPDRVLQANAAGVVSWQLPGVKPRAVTAGPDQGSVEATFNNDALTVARNEVLVYTYAGSSYLYTGLPGSPVAGSTAASFTKLSSPTVVDSQYVTLGAAADIGAAWTALTPKPVIGGAMITFATYANGVYLLTNEAAPGNAASWTFIGIGTTASTDNAVVRFDGTTGRSIQNSTVTITDTGDIVAPGDVAINGGDLTSIATTFNLANVNSTTVNFAGAASTLNIGAVTGTTLVRNNLKVNGNTTLGDAAADAVTVNASTMAIPNNLNIDTDTVFIDAAKNRVSIGKVAPDAKLEVDNGTVTTATPVLGLREIWNSATTMFTSILLNVTKTLADASSELINLKVGGASRFVVQDRGYMKVSSPTRDLFIVDAAAPDPVLQGFNDIGTSVFQVSAVGNVSAIGGLKTANIGTTAAANWKLGTVKAGAATLDATKFVEVEIGGTVVKLAVVA